MDKLVKDLGADGDMHSLKIICGIAIPVLEALIDGTIGFKHATD
jgi:hypothetical protein